jgi:protein-S-isoprenylcysteine O-methyltransferase Ste14
MEKAKQRIFSVELKSKRNIKNVTLTNSSSDAVLVEGRARWFGGIVLCVLAVLLGFYGLEVLSKVFKFFATSFVVPVGIGSLVVALFMFLFGWYLHKSAKPRGTLNVHNQ